MVSRGVLRAATVLSAVGIVLVSLGGAARVVRADANAPRWSDGDFWVYLRTSDNRMTRYDVVARETVSLSVPFNAVHLRKAVTTTSGSVNTTVTSDEWTRDSDLGVVKTSVVIGSAQVATYDPPLTQATFPLTTGKSWSVSSRFHLTWSFVNVTVTITGDATVLSEGSTSVPAGTFTTLAVRENGAVNLFAGSYSIQYYSEAAGNWVKRESYNMNNQKTSEEVLTSYRCASCSGLALIVIAIVVLAAIAIVGLLHLRARGRHTPPPPPMPPG